VVLSVMNGIDSEAMIGARVGMDKVLYCIAVGMDALRVGNRVDYHNPGRLRFGEMRNEIIGPRVQKIGAALKAAGIQYDNPVDMLRTLWWKFMVNVGVNQASAVMSAPFGVFQSHPEARSLMEDLMGEVIILAEAEEVDLKETDIQDWYAVLNKLSPQGKTSMLQDIEAGRVTEVAAFGGRVVDLGVKHKLPTPINQTVVRIIQVLEGREPGK
jgi:2-dehydropantoate 2-reductase